MIHSTYSELLTIPWEVFIMIKINMHCVLPGSVSQCVHLIMHNKRYNQWKFLVCILTRNLFNLLKNMLENKLPSSICIAYFMHIDFRDSSLDIVVWYDQTIFIFQSFKWNRNIFFPMFFSPSNHSQLPPSNRSHGPSLIWKTNTICLICLINIYNT